VEGAGCDGHYNLGKMEGMRFRGEVVRRGNLEGDEVAVKGGSGTGFGKRSFRRGSRKGALRAGQKKMRGELS